MNRRRDRFDREEKGTAPATKRTPAQISNMSTLHFGKHRGKPLADIPISYLRWVIENCDGITPSLRREIESILYQSPKRESLALPSLVSPWYRKLAVEFHPDRRGGSHEAMVAVNRARDLLLEMVGAA